MQKWVFKPIDSKVNQIHNTNGKFGNKKRSER